MTVLRDLVAKIKIDAKPAVRQLDNLDKKLDSVRNALKEIAKETIKLDATFKASRRTTEGRSKAASDEARKAKAQAQAAKSRKREEERDAARRSKAEQQRARERMKAIRDLAAAEKRAARERAKIARERAREAKMADRERAKAEKEEIKSQRRAQKRRVRARDRLGRIGARRRRGIASGASSVGQIGAEAGTGAALLTGGVAAATAGVVAFTRAWSEAAATLDTRARTFGLMRDDLQELSGAARLAGVDAEDVTDAISEMRIRMKDAQEDGTSDFAESLLQLGLNVKDIDGKSGKEQLSLIADGLARLTDRQAQDKVVDEIFGGDSGIRIIPLLDEGAPKIERLTAKFRELGGVLDQEAIDAAVRFRDEWSETSIVMGVVGRQLAEEISPAVGKVVKDTRDWVKENRKLVRSRVESTFRKMAQFIKELVPLMDKLFSGFIATTDAVGGLEQSLKILLGTMGAIKIAGAGVFGPWVAGAIGLITLMDTIEARQRRLNAQFDADTKETISQADPTAGLQGIEGTDAGRRIFALRKRRADALRKIANIENAETLGVDLATAKKQRDISEFSAESDDQGVINAMDANKDTLKELKAELKRINSTLLANKAAVEAGREDRDALTQGPSAPTPEESRAADAQDLEGLRRFQELASKRRFGGLSKSESNEFKRLASRLDRDIPEKKSSGRKKKKKIPQDVRTISETIGLPGGAGIKTISETIPKSLGTVVNNFNITNQIGVPSFSITVQAAPGSTVRSQAEATVSAMRDGFQTVVRATQRASVGQVLG